MRHAYAYIRFSSAEQRKGDSLTRQLREAKQWCERNGAVLDDSLDYLKELGRTGFDGSNLEEGGGLGLFLAAVKSGKVLRGSYLLVEKLDRFSRTDVDIAISFFGQVLRAGITIVSMRSGTEYTVEMLRRQPTAIMTAVMEFILANEESVKKSDRLLSAWAAKREKARQRIPQTKRGPLWLKLSEDRTTWEVLEDRAATVRRIFTLTAEGMGGYRLAALLNEEGVAPLENRPYWTQKAITRILNNRAVLGEFQPQKKVNGKPVDDGSPVAGYFPQVVETGLFYLAHQQIRAQKVGGRKPGGRCGKLFLFQKLAFDADTKSSLVVRATMGGKSRGYIRYIMPSAGLRGGNRITFPVDVFEDAMLDGLSEVKIQLPGKPELEGELKTISGKLAELTHLIEETVRAMEGQKKAYLGSIVAQVAAWEEEKANLARQHEELSARVENAAVSPLGELKSVAKMLKECEGEECERLRAKARSVIRSLVSRVTVKIKQGKDRLHKSALALVEFRHCPETRVISFTSPKSVVLVLKGYTATDFV